LQTASIQKSLRQITVLTVSYARRHPGHSRVPALTMQGQWLEEAGFTTGTQVEIK
jgi:toxic protein SymE